jgi:glycosyltransferase involved in cell wall biosynthesis
MGMRLFKKDRVLYFGNRGGRGAKYRTVQDDLTELLNTDIRLISVSEYRNPILKMSHMLWTFFRHFLFAKFVLIDTYSTKNFYYAYILSQLSRLTKRRYIHFLHGGNLPQRLEESAWMASQMFTNAYALIAPSGYLQDEFEKKGFSCKVIPNFIDIQKYPYLQRDINEVKIFWLRNFKAHYNPILAVKVVHGLAKKGYSAHLTMVGPDGNDGSLDAVLAYIEKHNLKSMVTITGGLQKTDWITMSEKSNIFLNTTNIDNTPISVIEAMALGLFVISTNVGGLPFLLQNYQDGVLVAPDSSNDIEDAVIKAVEGKIDFQSMVSKARQKVEAFDKKVVKKTWFKLLD